MKDDKAIVQIREVRHKISAKFGHDVDRLVRHYIRLQSKHKNRILAPVLHG